MPWPAQHPGCDESDEDFKSWNKLAIHMAKHKELKVAQVFCCICRDKEGNYMIFPRDTVRARRWTSGPARGRGCAKQSTALPVVARRQAHTRYWKDHKFPKHAPTFWCGGLCVASV